MAPPPPPPPTGTAVAGSPGALSPTQDEARCALELLMTFCQRAPGGLVEPQEFIMMGKLMEKLRVRGGARAVRVGVVVEGREREREEGGRGA